MLVQPLNSGEKMNKINYVALCDSDICSHKYVKIGMRGKTPRYGNKYLGPQRKDVSTHTIDCPQCSSALFWMKEEELTEKRQKVR